MNIKNYSVFGLLACMLVLVSCENRQEPGRTFIPDMQYSAAIDAYDAKFERGTSNRLNETSALLPVEGTIARGHLAKYTLPNTDEGYEMADSVMSPIEMTDMTVAEGKALYTTYCAICHGKKLDGAGSLYESGKFPAMPADFTADAKLTLTEGKMFHVITHGKGVMGSHAGQVNAKERWKIVHYIKSVQEKIIAKQ